MTRRPPGTGTVERLPSGRWRYRITTGGKRYGGTAGSEDEATRALDALRDALCDRAPTMPGTSLGAWGARWLAARVNRSADNDLRDWRRYVETTALAEIPIPEITRRDCKRWLREVERRPKSLRRARAGEPSGKLFARNSILRMRALLRVVLRAAVDEGLIASNPAADLHLERGACAAAHVREYLDPSQIAQLFAQPLPADVRAAYAVGCYAGLRPGELMALHWADVHLDHEPRIVVRRSHGATTKNRVARTVPLLPPAVAALQAWKAIAPAKELVWPSPKHGGRLGRGYDWGWANQPWCGRIGWRERAGLPPSKEFYGLRHTCATGLLQGWWTAPWRIEEVQQMLGHQSVVTTQVYAKIGGSYLLNKVHGHQTPGNPTGGQAFALVIDGERGISRGDQGLSACEYPRQGSKPGYTGSRTLCGADSAAQELLHRVADGQPVSAELLDRLVAAARTHRVVQLIQQVEAGGPFVLRAAIELAGEMLSGQRVEEDVACR